MPFAAPISAARPARSFGLEEARLHRLRRWHGRQHGSDAMLLFFRQADPELQAEGPGHLVREEAAHPLASSAMDNLAHCPGHRDGMVSVARPWFPESGFASDDVDHAVPVVELACSRDTTHMWHADRMVQRHGDGRSFLSCLSELRPVSGDRRVEIELAAIREHVCTERHTALGRREDDRDRILVPRFASRCLPSAPDINEGLALKRDRARGAHFAARLEIGDELVHDAGKLRVAGSFNVSCLGVD
jgi:hypothetical protein